MEFLPNKRARLPRSHGKICAVHIFFHPTTCDYTHKSCSLHKSGQTIINERAKVSTKVDKTITLNIYELSSARHGAKVVFR